MTYFFSTIIALNFVIVIKLIGSIKLSLNQSTRVISDFPFEYPPITIIKPVYGSDKETFNNFQSWALQDYPGELEIIFSFQELDDPAIPLAKAIEGPHQYKVIVHPVLEGFSGKMSNLLHGLDVAQHDLIIFSDSDIYAQPNTCKQIVHLYQQGADLISCLTRHVKGSTLWGRIYSAFWNFEHMAFIAPSIIKYGRDATGGTMTMNRTTLNKIGGLEAFKDYIAEDVAMGRQAHDQGLKVVLGPLIDSPVGSLSFKILIDKFTRAALFSASMDNKLESVQYGILFSYLLILPGGTFFQNPPLLYCGLILMCLRFLFASYFWFKTQNEKKLFWEIWLSDIIFICTYARSLFIKKVSWGGIEYQVLTGGKMKKLD